MNVKVLGIGHTKFGHLDKKIDQLMFEASLEALSEARLKIDEIDAIYIANFSSGFSGQCHLPAVLASCFGKIIEASRIESACASGALAFKDAVVALSSEFYDTALVIGVEKMSDTSIDFATRILAGAASRDEIQHGTTFPSLYALMARRHFYEYGTTEEQLAEISVKNHENALHNPLAHFHKQITVDQVLSSKIIASPLKLLDCSPISDGAAAVVISTKDDLKSSVILKGFGHATDAVELFDREGLTTMHSVREASKKAYKMADLESKDIDIAELHDCFTIAEVIQMEDLGFCSKGEGGKMVEDGRTKISGEIPINTSGGLKAKGHPIGATGVSQIVEIVKQLQGKGGKRQVPDADVGLCCNIGGSGSSALVSIFSR